jgi:hypothetical protein
VRPEQALDHLVIDRREELREIETEHEAMAPGQLGGGSRQAIPLDVEQEGRGVRVAPLATGRGPATRPTAAASFQKSGLTRSNIAIYTLYLHGSQGDEMG